MASHRQSLGRWGETLAEDYLSRKGYSLLERNFRSPFGEIDLIVQKMQTLVFVEVKTRASETYGLPEASITVRKRQHLIQAAQAYLQSHLQPDLDWRIDVIAIRKPANNNTQPEIIHFENAIT
ncbi:MAG TPA: YraN family protein [Chloroflexi bacterium]|nr:YraN family protein [Chloroflexota bacterium]HBY06243.1 YraN family protein [Chloroflexota bacterium]